MTFEIEPRQIGSNSTVIYRPGFSDFLSPLDRKVKGHLNDVSVSLQFIGKKSGIYRVMRFFFGNKTSLSGSFFTHDNYCESTFRGSKQLFKLVQILFRRKDPRYPFQRPDLKKAYGFDRKFYYSRSNKCWKLCVLIQCRRKDFNTQNNPLFLQSYSDICCPGSSCDLRNSLHPDIRVYEPDSP